MTKLAIVLKIPKNPVVFVQPNKSTAEKRPKKRINPHFAPAFFQKMRLQNEYKFKATPHEVEVVEKFTKKW